MKKIYSLIAVLFACFAGSVQAQSTWTTTTGENVTEDTFTPGEGHYYVLKGGVNTKADGSEGKDVAGTREYLSSGAKSSEIKHEAVFSFIPLKDEVVEDHQVYVLKNVANGMYLAGNGAYSKYMAKAFQFTMQLGVEVDEASINDKSTWTEYSNAISATRSTGAAEMGAWVLCSSSARQYMCFYGNPAMANYIDTNNWLIYEVEGTPMSPYEVYMITFNKYFSNGFDGLVSVGTDPGCVSQDFYNKFKAVYDDAESLAGNTEATQEEVDAMVKRIEDIMVELDDEIISFEAGYYVIQNLPEGNDFRGYLAVGSNGKGHGEQNAKFKDAENFAEISWTTNDMKYIWKLEEAPKGRLYFKNYTSGTYLGTNNDFAMTEEAEAPFNIMLYKDNEFLIGYGESGKSLMHMANHTSNKLINYDVKEDHASRWLFLPVAQTVLDTMEMKVVQNGKNQKMAELVKEAKNDFLSTKYSNFIEGNMYKAPADSGLVTSFMAVNFPETSEGSLAGAFDGNLTTYYHTAWQESLIPEGASGSHWVKVDLGKALTDVVFKLTKRQGAANGHVSKYVLYTPADGDAANPDWDKEVYVSDDSIAYQYDNNTHIVRIKFDEPVRYIRFDVQSTRGRDAGTFDKMTAGTGPMWHCSEFRFYDPEAIEPNPVFNEIPEDVRKNLEQTIAKAEQELKDKEATDATYAELEAAQKAFWEAYPDPAGFNAMLEDAKGVAKMAVEGEELANVGEGAPAKLQEVVDAVEAEVKTIEESGKALTFAQIEGFEARLRTALDEFHKTLVVPENGQVFRIVSVCGYDADGVTEKAQNETCVVSENADFRNGYPVFRYKANGEEDLDMRLNTLWVVEKSDAGFAFKNLATGFYLNNVFEGKSEEEIENLELEDNKLGWSKEPKHFKLRLFGGETASVEASFVLELKEGSYMNFQNDGKVMVHYSVANDAHAPFELREVSLDNMVNKVDVTPGKPQIVTLPYAVSAVHRDTDSQDTYFEVLGVKEGYLQLSEVDGEIPAGTPFIVRTAEEKFVTVDLSASTLEDAKAMEYNHAEVVKNGLVSAPEKYVTVEGRDYGIIWNKSFIASEGGEVVPAGTGYLNNTVATTDKEGTWAIMLEGTITGEATSVENVEMIKNVPADVYTISGVKVRSNVKAANATKGLPKGVYVVAGKKVIVK